MESKRQLKVSKLLQKELAEIFQKDVKSLFGGSFITVTRVQVSPDLSFARVYVSLLMEKDKKAVLENINSNKKQIRNLLGVKIGKQMRVVPELAFFLDENAEYATKMDELFAKLDIPPAPEEEVNDDE